MLLKVENLCCGYAKKTVISGISFALDCGDLLCLLGPNGIGKTTLFKTILGLLPPQGGSVLLNGIDTKLMSRKEFAAQVGYVPQAHTPPFSFSVIDVVTMGRVAHLGFFSSPTAKDRSIAEDALRRLSISGLRDKVYTEISGGERQLVLIARALTQAPKVLIMDEPTSNLDFGNQVRVLDHIRQLAKGGEVGVIMTTHYPNHALRFASKVAVLGSKDFFTIGKPEQVITSQYIQDAYGVSASIVNFPAETGGDVRVCIPQVT